MKNESKTYDILNHKQFDDQDWLDFFNHRLSMMRAKRQKQDGIWNEVESQTTAISFYDNEGTLHPNIPVEETLIETYVGRTNGKMKYDIIPDGQANKNELTASKFTLEYFLDGSPDNNFWIEDRKMRYFKSKYGNGIRYTGIRVKRDTRHKLKKDGKPGVFTSDNYEEYEQKTRFLYPKTLNTKDYFNDDRNYGNPSVQDGEDGIMKRAMTMAEFKYEFPAHKYDNINDVEYRLDPERKNMKSVGTESEEVVVYYYFNKLTKTFLIVVNEKVKIFNGLFVYEDGKLPFVNCQHYPNDDSFRTKGIPRKIAYLKASKSEILEDILQGAAMSSGVNLVVGNDEQLAEDWTVGGRGVNLWRTTGGAEGVQQVNTSPNLGYFTNILSVLDMQIAVDSGINPKEQLEPVTDRVGIQEIIEGQKDMRNASVDMSYEMALDEALTMTLSRIKEFAPSLAGEEIKNDDGKTMKIIFPRISVKGHTVEQKGKNIIFTEDYSKDGYFELKNDTIKGLGVKIITTSTASKMPILEREKINGYIENVSKLANMASLDQSGKMLQDLSSTIPFDDLMMWINNSYGYDSNGLVGMSKKDEIDKENSEMMKKMSALIGKLQTNANTQQTPTTTGATEQPEMQNQAMGQEQVPSVPGQVQPEI